MSAVGTAIAARLPGRRACFVLGLHLMNSPATARRGNQLSAAGMTAAIVATVVLVARAGTVTVDRLDRAGRRQRWSARSPACSAPGAWR